MYKVFLSSTSRDLAAYREAVHRAIDRLDSFILVRMEDFGARDATPRDLCARLVSESQVLVGLVGHCYGSCPLDEVRSFTELEYRAAADAGLSRLMFFAPDNFPIPATMREPDEAFQRQRAFRAAVMTERTGASFDSPEQLASAVTTALANWQQENEERLAEQEAVDQAVTPQQNFDGPLCPNPYRGLEAFRKEDADRFFGREALVDKLWKSFLELHRIPNDGKAPVRILAILGASGSGKSSVAQAGLLAELDNRPLPGRPSPPSLVLTPEARPLESLAVALARLSTGEQAPAQKAQEFEQVLCGRDDFDGLRYLAVHMLSIERAGVILLVDQFEEVFSLCDDVEQRETFIGNLMQAAREPGGRVSVILTLRSDFLGEVNRHAELSQVIAAQNVVVPVMDEADLRQAIEEPARRAGREIDPGTVDLLIEQTEGRDGALPLLEFVLTRIWDGFGRNVSAAETVRALGGVGGALAKEAQQLYDSLNERDQAIARRAMVAMVRLGEGARDTRRRAPIDEMVAKGEVAGDVLRVLQAFARPERRLITLASEVGHLPSAEVTHEALFEHWDELQEWLARGRDDIRLQRRLNAAAIEWMDHPERPDGLLWQPPLLDLLRQYHRRHEQEMTDLQVSFFKASKTLQERREREAREFEGQAARARQRRLVTAVAVAAAVVASVLATAAGYGFWSAQEAAVNAKAGSFWYRLQLVRDDLQQSDVMALWDLSQQNDEVRIEVVRQLVMHPILQQRFGLKPQPVARAIGLRWPDEASEIVKNILARVAGDQFHPGNGFELIAYMRTLGALEPWLDDEIGEGATRNIAGAIDRIASEQRPDDREIWTLAEAVEVFDSRLGRPDLAQPARERLQAVVDMAVTDPSTSWRDRAVSRAIETLAPQFSAEESLRAIRYLVPRLGQDRNSWTAQAVPRALLALLPQLEPGLAPEMLQEVPAAIAHSAGADPLESSGLLTLIQVAEALCVVNDAAVATGFGEALTATLARPQEPYQRAALARAAIPYLERSGGSPPTLLSRIVGILLVPESGDLDPRARSLFRQNARQSAEVALRQALPEDPSKEPEVEEALKLLLRDWSSAPSPNARVNTYRRAGQVRLLAVLAPQLTEDLLSQATAALLAMLPQTRDEVTREAIARALAALAPNVPEAERREPSRKAKGMLATTGSTEEATAWARTIAALAPNDVAAATAEMVEVLKYPTATEGATAVLLEALAARSPDGAEIAGRSLPDPVLLDWLEERTPGDDTLARPPVPPEEWQPLG